MPEPNVIDPTVNDAADDDGMDDLLIEAGLSPEEPEGDQPPTPDSEDKSGEQPTGDSDDAPKDEADDKDAEKDPGSDDEAEKPADSPEDSEDEDPKFKYKGKEYTLDDLRKDKKLFAKVFTSAEQQTHFQELHNTEKQEVESLKAQVAALQQVEVQRQAAAQQPSPEEAAAAGPSPDQLRASYDPVTDEMIKDGWIEADMNELYPNAVAGVVSLRDEAFTRIAQIEAALGQIVQQQQGRQVVETQQTVFGKINGIFDNLSSQGGIFAPLESQETRQQFLTHLEKTLNPEVDTLLSDPSVLRDLWIGHNHQKLIEATEAKNAAKIAALEAKRVETATQMAVGEGGGVSPSSGPPTAPKTFPGEEDTWGDL